MILAGVDEVGRGPLAGPVCAAAVILPPGVGRIAGAGELDWRSDSAIDLMQNLRDSKQLSVRQRGRLELAIKEAALDYALGWASVREIDERNILGASLLAMERAVFSLSQRPDEIQIDGNRVPSRLSGARAIVGGDRSVPAIAAASILAKQARDAWMTKLHAQYPEYDFERHSGYPTRQHLEAIRTYGICPEHRKSFKPVANAILSGERSAPRGGVTKARETVDQESAEKVQPA